MKSSSSVSGSVGAVFDALHGNINLSDFLEENAGQVEKIASSRFMKRLQRIKQLGFVSQNFLSAQHNRYAHALGTAHIMRRLIEQVEREDGLFDRAITAVHELTSDAKFNAVDGNSRRRAVAYLKQHMLVSALVQDVGELPYETASAGIFVPGEAIRMVLGNADIDLNQVLPKNQFTLYFIWENKSGKEHFYNLSKMLLTYLITGLLPKGKSAKPELSALRQMLDGKGIDADRIDYVFRDAFHTIGVHHLPDALIDSIETYDENGTILSHVRPALDFIVTRAMLWSNVYLSPENRFRIILLKAALTELNQKKPDEFCKYFGFRAGEITPEDFLNLDDVLIDNAIRSMVREKLDLNRAPAELLEGGALGYDYRWIKFSRIPSSEWKAPIKLPTDFYWDTYADYRARNHSLYDKGAIRIRGTRYALIGSEVELESCIGPFSTILEGGKWPAFPMPNHMAWFAPKDDWDSKDDLWRDLVKFKDTGQLTQQLEFRDPIGGVTFVTDTRGTAGFKTPAIFLAFSWDEKEYVDRLAGILHQLKRQYWALTDGGIGYGGSPPQNSKDAVQAAGAVILLVSKNYLTAYDTRGDGPIHAEVTMMDVRSREIPIVPIALDEYADLQAVKSFPWGSISHDGVMPFLGTSVRYVSSDEFRRRIENALKYIDGFKPRVP